MKLQPKTKNRFLLTTALTTVLSATISGALATECSNPIADFTGNCEITTTGQDYTIAGLNNGEYDVIKINSASVNSVTINNGATVSSNYYGAAIQIGLNYNYLTGSDSTINTITNNGTLSSAHVNNNDYHEMGIANGFGSTIINLVNMGTIEGSEGSIFNQGTIENLTNAQTNLSYYDSFYNIFSDHKNNLPQNYYTYFTNHDSYGKITFANLENANATMSYGVKGSGYIAGETYSDVMTFNGGRTEAINLISVTGVNYSLIDRNSDGSAWDLLINSISNSRVASSSQAASNSVAHGAATVIDNNPNLLALFDDLTTDQQVSDAASQTLPLLVGGANIAAKSSLANVNNIIQSRSEGNNLGISSGDEYASQDRKLWVKPFASWVNQDTRKGVSGYDANIYGAVVGVDDAMTKKLRLGVALAYARANIDGRSKVAPQSSNIDMYQLIGYGSYNLNDNTELNFQLDGGLNRNKGQRNIAFTSSVASSEYNSYTGHAALGLAQNHKLSEKVNFTPSIRSDYTYFYDQSYSETGAGLLNLNVNRNSYSELLFSTSGKIAYDLDGNSSVYSKLGLAYDAINQNASITASFAGAPGASFVTRGLQPSPWIQRAGVGISRILDNGFEMIGEYNAEARKDFTNQTLSFKVRLQF